MKNLKPGINLLGLVGVGFLIAGYFLPWWGFATNNNTESYLYTYIIKGPVVGMIGYNRSPQMVILMVGLIVAIVLGLVGSIIRGLPGRILLVLSGATTFAFIWRFYVRLSEIIAFYNVPFQGKGAAEYMGNYVAEATTSIQPGLYLTGIGAVLLFLAIFVPDKA